MSIQDARESKGQPLVHTPIIKKKKHQPRSIIPGIPHFIEGMPRYSEITRTITRFGQKHKGDDGSFFTQTGTDAKTKNEMAQWQMKKRARKNITSIVDPLQGAQDRRRSAARKRMRGRLGTLLSSRETLS